MRIHGGTIRAVLVAAALAAASCSGSSSSGSGPAGTATPSSGGGTTAPGGTAAPASGGGVRDGKVYVYWDQNEEMDALVAPDGKPVLLTPPYDPNGQMCLVPDGSGRFVTGYNPTNLDQDNPGNKLPFKDPPVGMSLWNADGTFANRTYFVPGPYTLPGRTVGGDIPPDASNKGHFNDNGTMTGCTFDKKGNLFASDLGTAQGQLPPPDDGRVIEWFAPDYAEACVVVGPTAGGAEPHHVGGTGGLRNPGTMATDDAGNVLVAEAGALTADGQPGGSHVLRLPAAALPSSASQCAGNVLSPPVKPEVAIDTAANGQRFALGIARDPSCSCWAVSSVFGSPAVAWYDDQGRPVTSRAPVPGSSDYSPFGIAFAPDGTLYLVDIHISCQGGDCGPTKSQGGLLRVTFTDGRPSTPARLATGMEFPTSVTVCDSSRQTCPWPRDTGGTVYRGTPGTTPGSVPGTAAG